MARASRGAGVPDGTQDGSARRELPRALRAGLRAGERRALAALFDLYFERIYNYVRRLVREDHLAEDLTQDVFLQVQRARSTYDPERDPRAWLFAIATNRVRAEWRSKGRSPEARALPLDLDAAPALPSSNGGAPAESALLERTRALVEDLPRGMRITVLLHAYEGLPFDEVAAILRIRPDACRKRYSRALKLLREQLELELGAPSVPRAP